MIPENRIRWLAKPVVWLVCLAPLAQLVWLTATNDLGANPQEFMNRFLGDWAIRLLLVALAVTPLRMLTDWNVVLRFRRLLGLFAFFYIYLHLASYVALDQVFNWGEIWKDIVKRWYITVGVAGVLCLLPLAVTSTKGWIKRLGGRNWNRLHKLVYPASALACLHFYMMRKGVQLEPIVYAVICSNLLAFRAAYWLRRRTTARTSSAP